MYNISLGKQSYFTSRYNNVLQYKNNPSDHHQDKSSLLPFKVTIICLILPQF